MSTTTPTTQAAAQSPAPKVQEKSDERKCYVGSGKHHYIDRNGVKRVALPGEPLQLSNSQFDAFKDKLTKRPIVDDSAEDEA